MRPFWLRLAGRLSLLPISIVQFSHFQQHSYLPSFLCARAARGRKRGTRRDTEFALLGIWCSYMHYMNTSVNHSPHGSADTTLTAHHRFHEPQALVSLQILLSTFHPP